MIFLNASSYGLYLVLVKPLMKKYQTVTVVKWLFLFGFIIVFPFGYEQVSAITWSDQPLKVFLVLAYIIIGVTIMAYFFNAWALSKVNPSLVGIYIYLQPLLASTIAIFAGVDSLSIGKGIAALLIFLGVYFVSIRR